MAAVLATRRSGSLSASHRSRGCASAPGAAALSTPPRSSFRRAAAPPSCAAIMAAKPNARGPANRLGASRPLGPRRPARSACGTKVVAFRDAHRAQQLLDTASEFVGYWMLGRQEGPTGRVMAGLGPLVAADVKVDVHGLLVHTQDMGTDGLARLLSADHRPAGLSLKHWHRRVCAANEDTDTVFCLMEMRAEDEDGHPRSCYQVLKLDFMYDDVVRRVTRVLERGQWDSAGDGLTPLLLAPLLEREEQMEAEAEEQQGHGAGEGRGVAADRPVRTRSTRAGGEVVGNDLPVERIVPQSQVARFTRGLSADKLRDTARTWCLARNSGIDARTLLEPHLAPDFRLWDAYGLLPLVCSVGDRDAGQRAADAARAFAAAAAAAGGAAATLSGGSSSTATATATAATGGGAGGGVGVSPTGYTMALMMGGGGCMAPREAVFDIIDSAKNEYDVQMTPYDLAVSYTHNVVFSHWYCKMTPKGPNAPRDGRGRPLSIEQECVEVDIFDAEGRLTDAWMFRDALDFEKHVMMARRQQVAEDDERRRRTREQRHGGGGGGGGHRRHQA